MVNLDNMFYNKSEVKGSNNEVDKIALDSMLPDKHLCNKQSNS